jgi:head-tail adaptor
VTTDRGAIVIHTPEPMDVVVIRMNGKVAYRGEVTDGQRIMVSSGIYAVNGQLVRVK